MLDANDIFQMLGLVFWGSMLLLIWLAVWLAKKILPKQRKWAMPLAALVVVFLYGWLIVPDLWEAKKQQKAAEQRYLKAKAIFDERCKSAGEKIYKTVDDVDGITLLNIWPKRKSSSNYDPVFDPMMEGAGLVDQRGGGGYIEDFMYTEWRSKEEGENQRIIRARRQNDQKFNGYKYIDVKQNNEDYLRYRLKKKEDKENVFDTMSTEKIKQPSRYAVSFTNTINPEDRKHWVAGPVTVTITDMQTGEVMATKTWYSMEPGLGSKAGARQPWLFAEYCNMTTQNGTANAPIRFFVDQVIKPKQGE